MCEKGDFLALMEAQSLFRMAFPQDKALCVSESQAAAGQPECSQAHAGASGAEQTCQETLRYIPHIIVRYIR